MRETEQQIRTPRGYKVCDGITEAVIYFMVIFTPWAFGTTENWSIWAANIAAYMLGGMLVAKWVIRWKTGYAPVRWGDSLAAKKEDRGWKMDEGGGREGEGGRDQGSAVSGQRKGRLEDRGSKIEDGGKEEDSTEDGRRETEGREEVRSQKSEGRGKGMAKALTAALASLTVFILAYCLTSALNARATFYPGTNSFEYHDYIEWLPHTYDKESTWQAFWTYMGLAFFFWATRDWLLGKTSKERRMSSGESREEAQIFQEANRSLLTSAATIPLGYSAWVPIRAGEASPPPIHIPTRLRRLLWVMCINGGLLALEGILQRLDGTGKLLWLVEPHFTKSAEGQFGPYPYRGSAAAYLNLVWPVCIGFWLAARKASARIYPGSRRGGGRSHALLLPSAVVMIASPIFSMSRGGAIVAIAQILTATVILFLATRREGGLVRAGVLSVFMLTLALTGYLGWRQLQERLENTLVDNLNGRLEVYENAKQIAHDFPVLGTGAGSFGSIYLLYKNPSQAWEAYLHDDWLETRITFGWVGFIAIFLVLAITVFRWFIPNGIKMPWSCVSLLWLSVAGCLVHAKFDFPFQIYSIVFLFLLLCSVLFCVSRR